MNNIENLHEKKKKQAIGLAIAFVLITGTFGIIFYINTDALVEITFPLSFTMRNESVIFGGIDLTTLPTITPVNATSYQEQLKETYIAFIFDDQLYKLNYTETLKLILDPWRNETGRSVVNTSAEFYMQFQGGRSIAEMAGFHDSIKIPKGLGLVAIVISFDQFVPNIASNPPIMFIGIIPDIDNASKVVGFEHINIVINSLYFDTNAYPSYYNYMANRTDQIPSTYPYRVEFRLERNLLGLSDFIARGY